MNSLDLREEILMLIQTKREGEYWDFKEKYHLNAANLLHDIICMANNLVDRDSYIIFGIRDQTFEIVGVKDDENRRNQQQMIDFLKHKKFSAGIRPSIKMQSLMIMQEEVDVIIIKNSTTTPYFLIEDFSSYGRKVRSGHIYTRIGDTNTDIDKVADINYIEYLWKKRFMLMHSPLEQIIKRLEHKEEWVLDECSEGYIYYNIYKPEFKIVLYEDENAGLEQYPDFYAYAMNDPETLYRQFDIQYQGIQQFRGQLVVLDSGRYPTVIPEKSRAQFLEDYDFGYFIEGSTTHKLSDFFYIENNDKEGISRKSFFKVILLFKNEYERDQFIVHVQRNESDFKNKLCSLSEDYSALELSSQYLKNQVVKHLNTGKALNQMLIEYRNILDITLKSNE